MNDQYEYAIEQCEARLQKCEEGVLRCRNKAKEWHSKWIAACFLGMTAATAFVFVAATVHWIGLFFALACCLMALVAAIEAPKTFNDFQKHADEWERMASGERDYLASLQVAQREWRGY